MKKLIALIIFSFLLPLGCNEESDVSSSIQEGNRPYQLIKLPPKAGLSVETTFSTTETIDGADGGDLKIKESYVATNGETVKIDAKLKIKKNSFNGIVDITMTIDDQYAAVSFTPQMVFSDPAELNLKFEGIDLDSLNVVTGDYDFVYIDDYGNIELVAYNAIHVNESKTKIWVNKADINHFSRYGWIR
jgi:hypothetical protein